MRIVSVALWCLCLFAVDAVAASRENASLEFKRIVFPEGRPRESEATDIDRIIDAEQQKVLRQLLQALKDSPTIGVTVVGYTDARECSAVDCDALSLRGARCVFDWLIANGLPPNRLRGPEGKSATFPIGDETDEGRAVNRRVQLEPFLASAREISSPPPIHHPLRMILRQVRPADVHRVAQAHLPVLQTLA
jgi:hypothetical protein